MKSAEKTAVHLEQWGQGGAPLLCLHGLGGGAHFFAALGQSLSGRARVIAPDLPGAGHTPLTSNFSFDAAADLALTIAREHAGGRAWILGHSMGTIIALEAVRREPSLVAGLILVGGLPAPTPAARARLLARAERIERHGLHGLGPEVAEANFSRRTLRERPELAALFGRLFEMQQADAYIATARALASWTERPLPPLDAVRCLVVTGAEDRYAPPDAVRAFAATLRARTRVEILPECGHLPFLEQADTFAALVSDFLIADANG